MVYYTKDEFAQATTLLLPSHSVGMTVVQTLDGELMLLFVGVQ